MKMLKRVIIFFLAIFLCGLGIAISTQANLGTTPISSVPYALTFIFPFSFGVTTVFVNIIFVAIQMIVLRGDFRKADYFQLVVTMFFGAFIDLGMHIVEPFKTDVYFKQIIMLVIGSMVLALGVAFEVLADLLYIPGEGVVRAFAKKIKKDFGKLKVCFDLALCFCAISLSFFALGEIKGLGEGTILSAILVGSFVFLYNKIFIFLKKRLF